MTYVYAFARHPVAFARAVVECVRLVMEAVDVQMMHATCVGKSPEWRMSHPEYDRLPELDLQAWYRRGKVAAFTIVGEPPCAE